MTVLGGLAFLKNPYISEFRDQAVADFLREKNKNYTIIMTEKDYFKIKDYDLRNLHYLKVSLEIKEKEKLLKKITRLHETN